MRLEEAVLGVEVEELYLASTLDPPLVGCAQAWKFCLQRATVH
jgi:hypothetical protein